ncbi:TPA: hypothetical protein TXS27_001574 [Streptococcus suis]|nr:Uncharacterised protein [Streptococcus suis]CYV28655.1 Uncharacterised protein [Streptococcus suis]HEL1692623.1 hypothetical protein [Streptococcus suis]HEM5897195.1 hypothetical protein [Streptococcus suis]HEM5953801.1 hypothetical protein [Streptococcus suis]
MYLPPGRQLGGFFTTKNPLTSPDSEGVAVSPSYQTYLVTNSKELEWLLE